MRYMTVRIAIVLLICSARVGEAQVTPAAGYTPPDDTPSIRVGATLFADWIRQQTPTTTDSEGNTIKPNAFNVARAYINVTGNISHIVAFRITPDVARETSSFSTLNGSLVFRIKYAYAQFNLDDWMAKGTFARLGIQQMPWLDFVESIYRYRFQGTLFPEREGFFASADAGASFRYPLPSNYGDIHVGVYNGENYNRAEPNDQKALMFRASVRPFAAGAPVLRGIRATVFYDDDKYAKNLPRDRFIGALNFEHQYVNAGFEYLKTSDQTTKTAGLRDGKGYSVWATPKASNGWEALLRYDHLEPNTITSQLRTRTIVGIAYWFPRQGSVSSALMFDYDGATFKNFTPAQPKQTRIGFHGLINF